MVKGRFIQLNWSDILLLIRKEYGTEISQIWYKSSFVPPLNADANIIEILIPDKEVTHDSDT
jgi:hypothetical protein